MARSEISDIVLTKQGKPKSEAPVTIKVVAGSAGSATMYTSETGSGTITSLLTDEDGFFSVWMEEGRYEVHGGAVVKTVENINQASVSVGSIGAEAVTAEKIAANAVTEAKIKNEAVSKTKLTSALQAEITAGAAKKEETLSAHSGTIKLDLSKAVVFHAELTGNAEFELTNAPAEPREIDLIVTQDGVGAHTWSVKSLSWVNTTPTFLTTAKLAYLVSILALNTGAEILGLGGIEAIGGEAVTSEKIASLAVTEAKLGAESVAEGKIKNEAVSAGKLKSEAVTTAKIGAIAVTRAKVVSELSKGIPLETGRSGELSGVTETTIAATKTLSTRPMTITLEGTGTVVGVEIKERKSGESFVLKFSASFTGFVNWVIYE